MLVSHVWPKPAVLANAASGSVGGRSLGPMVPAPKTIKSAALKVPLPLSCSTRSPPCLVTRTAKVAFVASAACAIVVVELLGTADAPRPLFEAEIDETGTVKVESRFDVYQTMGTVA